MFTGKSDIRTHLLLLIESFPGMYIVVYVGTMCIYRKRFSASMWVVSLTQMQQSNVDVQNHNE